MKRKLEVLYCASFCIGLSKRTTGYLDKLDREVLRKAGEHLMRCYKRKTSKTIDKT